MRYALPVSLLLFSLLFTATSVSAATIPVFGTGLDNSGQFLPTGAVDPHYTLTLNYLSGTTAFVAGGATSVEATSQAVPQGWPLTTGSWATDTLAQWIAPQADVVGIAGVGMDTFYTYQTTFDLSGFVLSSVVLTGHWTADNYLGQVSLNGTPIYSTPGGCGSPGALTFQSTSPFSISSGFVSGVNTLSFNVTNSGCFNNPPRTNPTGLLVDISGTGQPTAAVPEPAMLVPLTLGLAFAAFSYRRRRNLN